MKSKRNLRKICFYFFITASLCFSVIIIQTSFKFGDNSENKIIEEELDIHNLKTSYNWYLHVIVIDGDGATDWNWAKGQGWCTGSGNYSDPYYINNTDFNGDMVGSALTIQDTSAYFIIENCYFHMSGDDVIDSDSGLKLWNANNGTLINNRFMYNDGWGIFMYICNNFTLEENTIKYNDWSGLRMWYNWNIKVSKNTIGRNVFSGIIVDDAINNTYIENTITYNEQDGMNIDNFNDSRITGNTIEDNEFHGINIDDCFNNTISGNIIDSKYDGIQMWGCNENNITDNTINYIEIGIDMIRSNYSRVISNTIIGKATCIRELYCTGNYFANNKCEEPDDKKDEDKKEPAIPMGYWFFPFMAITAISLIIITKRKIIKNSE